MKSTPVLMGIATAAALSLAACGGTAGTPSGGPAGSPSSAALIHTASITVGTKTETVLKNAKGLTLYYFAADTPTSVACTGGCVVNWPPLLSSSGTPTSSPTLPGRLTVLNGANGNQVLYNGHPLYNYFKDADTSDANGQGIGGKWFAATPDLAAATAPTSTPYSY